MTPAAAPPAVASPPIDAVPAPRSPFDPPEMAAGHAVRGGVVAIAGQGVRTAIRLVGTVVLARLLTPEDFGLVAMVTVITGFVGMFTDVGLSAATIQRPTVTHEQVSTLFWLNVGLGTLLAALTAACAPLVAWFYDEPRLTAMTAVLACTFVIAGLTVQHQALLQRKMRFHTVTGIGIASQIVATATAVGTSWSGWGPWSLVFMSLTSGVVTMLLCWGLNGWLPGQPRRRSGVRGMLKFGGYLAGHSFLNYTSRNTDTMLVGWWWGAGPLGLYSRAYGLLMLPVQQISGPVGAVANAALARAHDSPSRFRAEFLSFYRLLLGLAVPVAACCFVLADEIILFALGNQWRGAVPLFRIFAVSSVVHLLGDPCAWLFVSTGRTGELFRLGLLQAPLAVVGVAVGLPFSPAGAAWGFAVAMLLILFPMVWWATRGTPVRFAELFAALLPAGFSATMIAAAAWLLCAGLRPHVGLIMALPVTSLLAGAVTVASVYRELKHVRHAA